MNIQHIGIMSTPAHWSEPTVALSTARESRLKMWWGIVWLCLEVFTFTLTVPWLFQGSLWLICALLALAIFVSCHQGIFIYREFRAYHFWMHRYWKGLQSTLKAEAALKDATAEQVVDTVRSVLGGLRRE